MTSHNFVTCPDCQEVEGSIVPCTTSRRARASQAAVELAEIEATEAATCREGCGEPAADTSGRCVYCNGTEDPEALYQPTGRTLAECSAQFDADAKAAATCPDCGATDRPLTITGNCTPCRKRARHQRAEHQRQLEAQGRAYAAARDELRKYLMVYGLTYDAADTASRNIMDTAASEAIDQEGT